MSMDSLQRDFRLEALRKEAEHLPEKALEMHQKETSGQNDGGARNGRGV